MKETRLFELAEQYRTIKEETRRLESQRSKIVAKMVKELQSRDVKAIKGRELQVTLVESETVVYDIDKALKVVGPSRLKKISKRVIDGDALHYEVQEGHITIDELERFSQVKPRKPYVSVIEVGG